MAKQTNKLKYELLLGLMAMIWGTTFVAQQIGMRKGLGPMTFNALRFTLGCFSLLPVISWRIRHGITKPADMKIPVKGSLAAGVFLFAAASFQQVGLLYTSSANAGFITGFYLIFVPLMGLFFGQRPAGSLWVGAVVCLVGLYFLSVTDSFMLSKGDLLVLICAVLWAAQIQTIDHVASRGDPVMVACLQFAVCALLSAIAALGFESCTLAQVKAGAGAVAYAGFLSVGIAFTLQVVCQKRCPPAPAAIIMSLEAVFAALAGYFVLNQKLTIRGIAGCGLIFAGIMIVQLVPLIKKDRDKPRED